MRNLFRTAVWAAFVGLLTCWYSWDPGTAWAEETRLSKDSATANVLTLGARPAAVRGEIVLARAGHDWMSQQIEEPCILPNPKAPGRLIMFYSAVSSSNRVVAAIGKAWADQRDPFRWYQDDANPVFRPGAAPGWDSCTIRLDAVLYVPEEDAYYIYYSGTAGGVQDRIGLAICPAGPDGYSGVTAAAITRYGAAPVLAPEATAPFHEEMASQAAVMREWNAPAQRWDWYMYYSYRGKDGILPGIRLATSHDGKTWTRHFNVDDPRGMGQIFQSTPDAYYEWHQIFKVGATYVLCIEVGVDHGARWRPGLAVSTDPVRGWMQLDPDTMLQTKWHGLYDDRTLYHVATPALYSIEGKWYLFAQACGRPGNDNYIDGAWEMWGVACDRVIPTRPGCADLYIPGLPAPAVGVTRNLLDMKDSSKPNTDSANSVRLNSSSPDLQLSVEADMASARLTRLGWDTEGTGRAGINLLKAPIELRLSMKGQPVTPQVHSSPPNAEAIEYGLSLAEDKQLTWEIAAGPHGLRMRVACNKDVSADVDQLELVFPFEPTTAVTSIISSSWTDDGRFLIPAIINAPDLGQMLVTCDEQPRLSGRIKGHRSEKYVTVTFDLPVPGPGAAVNLRFAPVVLPMPEGFKDEKRWRAARRGWFNMIQQSCGASGGGGDVVGVWANNVLSDPVSSVLYMLGDATLLIPELAPGVSMPPILRRAVDYWIDHKTNRDGLVAYTAGGTPGSEDESGKDIEPRDSQNVMDANPAVLIGAWCYVKAGGDMDWLKRRIENLEFLSRYMEKRDKDGDGLIESKQSGNSGSRPPRDPDCAWDCYTTGHKNAYVNTLAYRAWQGLAELEKCLGRTEQAQRYQQLAERLKASFLTTFYNPETGWLGLWRSRDGVLHDIHSDVPTSFAINYGLIGKDKGKEMLRRYWRALQETGFSRFDLGVPVNLRPIPREDMEVYFDFQQFLNGGCCVSNTSYLLNALYIVGMKQEAGMILDAMLKRQSDGAFPNGGGFQNGFVDKMGAGAEVFDWKGNPAGYEGHLVYCWAFLHSMLIREPALRERVYGFR